MMKNDRDLPMSGTRTSMMDHFGTLEGFGVPSPGQFLHPGNMIEGSVEATDRKVSSKTDLDGADI